MRTLCIFILALVSLEGAAQEPVLLDAKLQPVSSPQKAYYYGFISKQEGLWLRELYYSYNRLPARKEFFADSEGKVPAGEFISYHLSGGLDEKGRYVEGKKEGTWLRYYSSGAIRDSFTFSKGSYTGTQLSWYYDGMLSDSMQFDGSGNGVHVGWHTEGALAQAGLWKMDTMKTGRWKYYDTEGNLIATEDYNDGTRQAFNCFDAKGNPLDTSMCRTREAEFRQDLGGWRRFLEKNLNPSVGFDHGVKDGKYTVLVEFFVESDGSLSGLKPLTKHGSGMEEEVLRLLSSSPKWSPELKFGVPVRSYKLQPVTFMYSSQ